MSKQKKSKSKHRQWIDGFQPIDRVASRVVMRPKTTVPDPAQLRKNAKRKSNPARREHLLRQADLAEKKLQRSKAAKKAAETRMTSRNAEERARKALETAKWHCEND